MNLTWPELVMWAVVAGVGFPAAFRNRTALALCGTWLFAEIICRAFDENLPVMLYFVLDYLVLLVIFTKPEIRDCSPYQTFIDQLKALRLEHSPTDVIVIGIFPLMWLTYVIDIEAFYCWWMLWGLVQLQFFAAGWEALSLWRVARGKVYDSNLLGMSKLRMAEYG